MTCKWINETLLWNMFVIYTSSLEGIIEVLPKYVSKMLSLLIHYVDFGRICKPPWNACNILFICSLREEILIFITFSEESSDPPKKIKNSFTRWYENIACFFCTVGYKYRLFIAKYFKLSLLLCWRTIYFCCHVIFCSYMLKY